MKRKYKPLPKHLYESLANSHRLISEAAEKARVGRAVALDRDDIQMAKILKEIHYLLQEAL